MRGPLFNRRTFLGLRARAWTISLPVHVIAFAVLYFAALKLMQSEVFTTASEVAGAALSHEINEFAITAPDSGDSPTSRPHADFFTVHEKDFEIDLFSATGTFKRGASEGVGVDEARIREFIASNIAVRAELDSQGDRFILRSMRRVVARQSCASCHQVGQLLGVLSAKMDLTPQIQRVRQRLRRNLAILVITWGIAITVFAAVVERTVRRSARHLAQDLSAAEVGAGRAREDDESDLVLDPVAADLHHSLREFLRRSRERESELASRMVHTDQLASLGQLAAGLAHEIKSPLSGIAAALELLQEDLQEESQKQRCALMLEEIGRVDQTLGLLLSSARLSPPRLEETDLSTLLDEIRRFLAPALHRRNIALEVEVAAGVGGIWLDAAKIRQVLVNLINNAADAMGQDGRVTLRAAPFPDAGGVIVAVQDDGPGIPEEDRAKIFNPFHTTKFAGTGLGLTIAKTLVEQHGGRLEVESAPGEGATFLLLLPASTARPEADAAGSAGEAG